MTASAAAPTPAGTLIALPTRDLDAVQFTAYGLPRAQGSIRHLGKGRPAVHGNADTLLPWRAIVAQAARDAIAGHPLPLWGRGPRNRPIPVQLIALFSLPAPKTARPGDLPTTRGLDIDKGARALLDALTHILYADDSQVVDLHPVKVYAALDPLALPEPGVVIHARKVAIP